MERLPNNCLALSCRRCFLVLSVSLFIAGCFSPPPPSNDRTVLATVIPSSEALTQDAVVLYSSAQYSQARIALERVVRQNPSFQPALVYLGATLARLGDAPQATAAFRRAISIAPGTAEARQAIKWLASLEQDRAAFKKPDKP